jgi:polyisoprenoid-binding protein YceI
MIPPGSYEFGPSNATMVVKTGRAGMGKKVGHDLVIDVTDWSAKAEVGEDPADTTITATVDAGSLEVREGHGGVKGLTDDDKAEIKDNITNKILTKPDISFESKSANVSEGSATLSGDLTIMGSTQPVEVQLTDAGGGKVKATMDVTQSDFGIKPFTAMMGALKVADKVTIEIEANVPQE